MGQYNSNRLIISRKQQMKTKNLSVYLTYNTQSKIETSLLAFTLLFCVVFNAMADNGKNKHPKKYKTIEYGKWSIGVTMGPLSSYRLLNDNPRYTTGEAFQAGIIPGDTVSFNDKKFIEYRNKYDKIRWGSTWGINFEYKINNTFSLQFGSNLYGIGEKIYANTISEQEFKNVFGGSNDTIRNSFLVREYPLVLKFNIAPHVKYDLNIKKGFLTYNRHLVGMVGVGMAKPLLNNSSYQDYIHFGDGNKMINAIAGLGISQQLSNRFNLTLSSVFRYSFTPAIEYSSINEYYYTLGFEANLRYQFAKKKFSLIPEKAFDCFEKKRKIKKLLSGPRILYGFIHGINVSTVWGKDANNEDLGQYDLTRSKFSDYNEAKGGWLPKLGFHAGIHIEYNFAKNAAAIATDIMYSQKGTLNKYTYTWTDDPLNTEYMNTIIRSRIDYADMPVYLKIRIAPKGYLMAGGMFSVQVDSKTKAYYQHFNDQDIITGSTGTDFNYGATSFESYFKSIPNFFVKGFMLGYELNIDDNVDLNFRIQQTNNITVDYYKIFNITGQVSLIYMFNKRIQK